MAAVGTLRMYRPEPAPVDELQHCGRATFAVRPPSTTLPPDSPDSIASRSVATRLAALEPSSQIVTHAVEGNPVLGHRVAFPDGHRLILERVEVDRHAERRADFILAAVASADRA